jgi:hypothetical protein
VAKINFSGFKLASKNNRELSAAKKKPLKINLCSAAMSGPVKITWYFRWPNKSHQIFSVIFTGPPIFIEYKIIFGGFCSLATENLMPPKILEYVTTHASPCTLSPHDFRSWSNRLPPPSLTRRCRPPRLAALLRAPLLPSAARPPPRATAARAQPA